LFDISSVVSENPTGVNPVKTQEFIKNLDISKYERNGSDFTNPAYSPLRLGIPMDKLDIVYDYDFDRLKKVESELEGVDRKVVLQHIFSVVTEGKKTNTEKHKAILKFLHKSSLHNALLQPMYPDKRMVTDPLVLLELAEMRCGHVARIAVDLFESVGYKARLVQLGAHVIAEIYYDDNWHMFDGDFLGNGETPLDPNGNIPSVVSMSLNNIYNIDAVAQEHKGDGNYYLSYYYYNKDAYRGYGPMFYIKTAKDNEKLNKFYGWNYYITENDKERKLYDFSPLRQPGAPKIKKVKLVDNLNIHVEWYPSKDDDNDLLGYRVYVSENSRGWNYSGFSGSESSKNFWSSEQGWKPEMYENLFRQPPHEIALLKTRDNFITIAAEKGKTYFITIMPYDKHGESVGKKLYFMSNEIRIKTSLE
jgi:hypothetical protein